jgi:hypothetical protein
MHELILAKNATHRFLTDQHEMHDRRTREYSGLRGLFSSLRDAPQTVTVTLHNKLLFTCSSLG